MDRKLKIVSIDWRRPGDFSAVGQLTERLLSIADSADVYSIQCGNDRKSCRVLRRAAGGFEALHESEIFHDAVLNFLVSLDPSVFYVRLSAHLATLEFACKIAAVFTRTPLIVHYMDAPFVESLTPQKRNYVTAMYSFLIKDADRVYVIDDSVVEWMSTSHDRNAYVLGNYVDSVPTRSNRPLSEQRIRISYFGSLDKVMNADAILDICRVVSEKEDLSLTIWSNSGIWGDVKALADVSPNITVNVSELDHASYLERMRESDLLLLPYSCQVSAAKLLRHSFSNKLIDYLESGTPILAYGPSGIPTIEACSRYGVAMIANDPESLERLFVDSRKLAEEIDALADTMVEGSASLMSYRKRLAGEFGEYLVSLEKERPSENKAFNGRASVVTEGGESKALRAKLGLLIRMRFFDRVTNQQSLASTLMASALRRDGYDGFDYEI